MNYLIAFLFILNSISTYAGDDFQHPELIVTPVSQIETQENQEKQNSPDLLTIEIPDLVSQQEANQLPKKSRYLKLLEKIRDRSPEKLKKLLTKFKVDPEFQDIILSELDDRFKRAPETIIKSNSDGIGVRLVMYAGVGLGDYFVNKLKITQWSAFIPQKSLIGATLAGGFSVLILNKKNQKHIVLRLSIQKEKPIEVINWMAEALAGVTSFIVSEKFGDDHKWIQYRSMKYQKTNLGFIGTMVTHDGYYEHAYSTGAGGGLGASSFYRSDVHEKRLDVSLNIQRIINLKNSAVKTCKQVLRINSSTSK